MEYIEVKIKTTSTGIEHVSNVLVSLGFGSFVVDDEKDFLDFLENNKNYWDYVDEELLQSKKGGSFITLYLDEAQYNDNIDYIKQALKRLKEELPDIDLGSLEITAVNRNEEEWADNWKKYYKPLKIGKNLIIRPVWEEVEDNEGRLVLTLNPGMSFGTGMHETTSLCLEILEKCECLGKSLLDVGCGSGILSIASLLFGAKEVTAIDIDPNAAKIAGENGELNGYGPDKLRTLSGNILDDMDLKREISEHKYDIIVANIVADVIIRLLPIAEELISPHGIFIVSGIISDRLSDVYDAIKKSNFDVVEERKKNDWCAIILKNKILK